MQRMAGRSVVEGFLLDWVQTAPLPERRLPVAWLSRQQKAAELGRIERNRAIEAAREAELILGMAADCPDDDDPRPGTPGARSRTWRVTEPEFAGVSEFFPAELGHALNLGSGTARFRARRAYVWRDELPATLAALRRGEIDERRASALFDALQHARPGHAARVEAVLLPEATELSVARLRARAEELLLALDPAAADERRDRARRNSDVFVQPDGDGMATLGAALPADEAAEAADLITQLAAMAKADGDERPIGAIRAAIFSMLLRRPAHAGTPGVRATLTITAALASLEGGSSVPAGVNGCAITPAHLRELLTRVGALGLTTPGGGSLTYAITDHRGRLLATVTAAELTRLATRGCPQHPAGEAAGKCGCPMLGPPADTVGYTPTAAQRRFVKIRDRLCRTPNCGQRTGRHDLDHVHSRACGGATSCTNLCCLCRFHHRLKTFAGWHFEMDPDGTLHVTSPSGITRRTIGARPTAAGGRTCRGAVVDGVRASNSRSGSQGRSRGYGSRRRRPRVDARVREAQVQNEAKRGAQEALFNAIKDQAETNMKAALKASEKAALLHELAEAYRLTAGGSALEMTTRNGRSARDAADKGTAAH